ncbi:MAG: hypothetical protein HYX76_12290 [Acidobacteria bacterium]|nr:hypothetical protein [Acidobacteriota bacterium]
MDAGSDDALKQLHGTLQRYAGWLDRERTSVMVRADVRALGIAIDTCADPTPLLQTLDVNIARLPSGELRKMLRAAAGQIRRALAKPR